MKDYLTKSILILTLFCILFQTSTEQGYSGLICPEGYSKKITEFYCDKDDYFKQDPICPGTGACPTSYGCALTKEPKCPSLVSCPSTLSIRCPDNSCVARKELCNNYVPCPSFLPIRCPSGDCKFIYLFN